MVERELFKMDENLELVRIKEIIKEAGGSINDVELATKLTGLKLDDLNVPGIVLASVSILSKLSKIQDYVKRRVLGQMKDRDEKVFIVIPEYTESMIVVTKPRT